MSMACLDTANSSLPSDQTLTENAESRVKRPQVSTQLAAEPSTDEPAVDKAEQAKEDHSPEIPQRKIPLDSEAGSSISTVPSAYNKLRSQELLPERYVRQVLVLKPQGGLGSFKNLKQLVTAFKDHIQGIKQLRGDAGMVYGVVTPPHLKINKNGRGVLVDWDMPGMENRRIVE